MTEDSQHPKSESQQLLDRVSELIASLHEVQNARLSSPPPAHLSDVSGPTPEETDLGNFHFCLFTSVETLTALMHFISFFVDSDSWMAVVYVDESLENAT